MLPARPAAATIAVAADVALVADVDPAVPVADAAQVADVARAAVDAVPADVDPADVAQAVPVADVAQVAADAARVDRVADVVRPVPAVLPPRSRLPRRLRRLRPPTGRSPMRK
jgi:hypothetical protein